jgi:hypothetical protein
MDGELPLAVFEITLRLTEHWRRGSASQLTKKYPLHHSHESYRSFRSP